MCNGFGMIVSKDMKAYFTTPDSDGDVSHSEILKALGWEDTTNIHLRNFVRVECADWTIKSFRFDEDSTLPGWAEENKDEIVGFVKKALRRAAPARAEYEKVCDAARAEYEKVRAPARAEYEKVCAPARAEYEKVRAPAWAEYEKVCDAAWAEYEKVCAPARAEYEKVCDAAWAEYEKVRAPAWAEYEKVRAPAWAEYEKVCDAAWAEFESRLSKISGFVK